MVSKKHYFKTLSNLAQIVFPFALIAFTVIVVWLPFDLNVTPTAEFWFQRNDVESFSTIIRSFDRMKDRVFWFWSGVLGDWLTPDTFIGHQIVFILVYIFRGILTYFILRKLFPRHPKWALVVSLVSLFNPADQRSLFWLGALHVHAHDALFLLSVYLFLIVWDKPKRWGWIALLFFQNIVLWSYEGTFLLTLAVPALLFYLEKTWHLSKYSIKIMLLWYISPMICIIIKLFMYNNLDSAKSLVLRRIAPSIQVREIIDGVGKAFYQIFIAWYANIKIYFYKDVFLIYGGFVFVGVLLFLLYKQRDVDNEFEINLDISFLFITGILIIVLGFLPYALTERLRYRYDRTLLMPWIGAAIIITTIFWQLCKIERKGYLTILFSSLLIGMTVVIALGKHDRKISESQMQNAVLAQIVRAIPQPEEGSGILLIYEYDCTIGEKDCHKPKSLALRHNRVFTAALRFIYDDSTLSGFITRYSTKDALFNPENKEELLSLSKLIIIRYSPQKNDVIVESEVPHGLLQDSRLDVDEYNPYALFDEKSNLPNRACLPVNEFFISENVCLMAP